MLSRVRPSIYHYRKAVPKQRNTPTGELDKIDKCQSFAEFNNIRAAPQAIILICLHRCISSLTSVIIVIVIRRKLKNHLSKRNRREIGISLQRFTISYFDTKITVESNCRDIRIGLGNVLDDFEQRGDTAFIKNVTAFFL